MTFYTSLNDQQYRDKLTKLLTIVWDEARRDDQQRLRVRSDRGRIAQKRRLGMDNSQLR